MGDVIYDSDGFRSMFRECDIRGRVDELELNDSSVYRIISAYARFLRERGILRAVVGYDNRRCSPGFADASVKALAGQGIHVVFIGLCITPSAYYAQYRYGCEGLVMVTASHNPDGWSGFKLGKGYSKTLEPEDVRRIYEYSVATADASSAGRVVTPSDACYISPLDAQLEASSGNRSADPITGSSDAILILPGSGAEPADSGVTVADDAWSCYVDAVCSRINMGSYKPRIVLDAGNGGAGLFAYEIFQRLGCVTFQLNCDPDMDYPHYFPNPSELKNRQKLKELVVHPYIRADVGFSFDGDGDRLGVVDENGADVWSDIILALLSRQLLERKPGSTVVYDVKCSKTLHDTIVKYAGFPVMWKTGHSHIKAKMREMGADLAGERSGHIFFGGDDYYGYDDAIFAGAKLVEYMSNAGGGISEIVSEMPRCFTSPEIKAGCPDAVKYEVITSIVGKLKGMYPGKVNDTDGARVDFEHGWGLIRASSNLPELVLIFEADTMGHMSEIRDVFRRVAAEYPAIAEEWENDI